MFWRIKNVKFDFRWGTKPRVQKAGDWEWFWRHFRTWNFAESIFLSHFLIVSQSIRQDTVQKCVVYKKIRKRGRNLFSQNFKSWNDVRIIPILLFLVSRFCTPSEVKFHGFGTSKHGAGQSLWNFFLLFLSVHYGYFNEQRKKNMSYTL